MTRDRSRGGFAIVLGGALLAAGLLLNAAFAAEPGKDSDEVIVFAAASLSDAFTEIGAAFEAAHPGVRVRFNFAGSQQLAAQIEQGAAADLFASADTRWMAYLAERGLLRGDAAAFACNRLVVVIPRANPGKLATVADLARPGVKLVVAAASVPIGKYSRELLARLATTPGFAADFAARALGNIVSEEENVKSVVAKVQLGEADAGIVYRSDVTAKVRNDVVALEIADSQNVVASYPLAVLASASVPDAATALVATILSTEGQAILARHGLLPVESKPD